MAKRIRFDVSGQSFAMWKDIISSGPDSRLKTMCLGQTDKEHCLIVDRPPDLFAAILSMYVTGELHMPMTSCPDRFRKELEFWEISADVMEDCCFQRLQLFLDEQRTIKDFQSSLAVEDGQSNTETSSWLPLCRFKDRVWAIVDFRVESLPAKVYFAISLLMVFLSVTSLAFSTHPYFRRNMTNCERLSHMEDSGMENTELVTGLLTSACDSTIVPETKSSKAKLTPDIDEDQPPDIDYDYVYVTPETTTKKYDNNLTIEMDFRINAAAKLLKIKIPNLTIPANVFHILELVILTYFTVDFFLRIFSCPSLSRYFFSLINTTDAMALLGSLLHVILYYFGSFERFGNIWMEALACLQILRTLRLFRIAGTMKTGRVLAFSIRKDFKQICTSMLFVFVGVCTFASCVYLVEDEEVIGNIPTGWYWAVVTMTTVGYGDISPKTGVGRIIASMCALSGVLLFALTIPIFAHNFLTLLHYVENKQRKRKREPDEENKC